MEIKKIITREEAQKYVEFINAKYAKNPGCSNEEWAACLTYHSLKHNPGAQLFQWEDKRGCYNAIK